MKILGLITEYNPFHNGHIYHIQKAKEMIQPDVTIVVMSGNFVQRGSPAIIDKWKRSQIAIDNGIDLVIELPFVYACQGADYFSKGAIDLLHKIGVTDIVFGSESGDVSLLYSIATTIKDNKNIYDTMVKTAMNNGERYASACNIAISSLLNKKIETPNDILGLAYVKDVVNNNYPINMHCIKRTNDFHSNDIGTISSATAIRNALLNDEDILNTVPDCSYYKDELYYLNDYFDQLYYMLMTISPSSLKEIFMVEEGIENLLLEKIQQVSSINELVECLTSKRYTRGRIQRMLIHILMQNKKTDITNCLNVNYIRILAMNSIGKAYINTIKKDCLYTIISNYKKDIHPAILLEYKATKLYSCIASKRHNTRQDEYQKYPYIKK